MFDCPGETYVIWVCLKIGYIPNYSHLIGIMISKTIGFRGTLFSDKPISLSPSLYPHHIIISPFVFSILDPREILVETGAPFRFFEVFEVPKRCRFWYNFDYDFTMTNHFSASFWGITIDIYMYI